MEFDSESAYWRSLLLRFNKRSSVAFGDIDRMSVAGGVALAIGFLAVTFQMRQSGTGELFGNYMSPIFVTLYIALSTGHYLGLGVVGNNANFVDGVFGAFLVFTLVTMGWSITSGMPSLAVALLGIIFGMVIAHHRGWVNENRWIRKLVKLYGQGIVPLGIVGGVSVKIAVPLLESTNVTNIFNSLQPMVQAGILLLISTFFFMVSKFIELIDDSSKDN